MSWATFPLGAIEALPTRADRRRAVLLATWALEELHQPIMAIIALADDAPGVQGCHCSEPSLPEGAGEHVAAMRAIRAGLVAEAGATIGHAAFRQALDVIQWGAKVGRFASEGPALDPTP